jgi:hypothetical protein
MGIICLIIVPPFMSLIIFRLLSKIDLRHLIYLPVLFNRRAGFRLDSFGWLLPRVISAHRFVITVRPMLSNGFIIVQSALLLLWGRWRFNFTFPIIKNFNYIKHRGLLKMAAVNINWQKMIWFRIIICRVEWGIHIGMRWDVFIFALNSWFWIVHTS